MVRGITLTLIAIPQAQRLFRVSQNHSAAEFMAGQEGETARRLAWYNPGETSVRFTQCPTAVHAAPRAR